MVKQIISCLLLIVLAIETAYCLSSRLFRHKRMPDAAADDLLLSPHMTSDFGTGISDTQMIICKNRFDCEDWCRRTTNGLLLNKAEMGAGFSQLTELTDSHKLGIQLGRRNDCDKCGLIYANCDQRFLNFATKFWTQTKTISPKAKNDI